ncbi:MAG: helix-turn-helix domain-containing protein [Myxococcota bacterium]
MATFKRDPPRGVIAGPSGPVELRRYHPGTDLHPLVEHFWLVRWDLTDRPPMRQYVLPHPTVHLVVETGRAEVVGVVEGRFERVLEGRGRVLGIKLRPGAFAAFTEQPISELTGRTIPMGQMFGPPARRYVDAAQATDDDDALCEQAEQFLRALRPCLPAPAQRARDLVERVQVDPSVKTVEALARLAGLGPRSLQRLMRRTVGVSPKWILLRYRLHEALARLERKEPVDWAELAVELGYFDQAHFIKHFKAFVGSTPAQYSRRLYDRA